MLSRILFAPSFRAAIRFHRCSNVFDVTFSNYTSLDVRSSVRILQRVSVGRLFSKHRPSDLKSIDNKYKSGQDVDIVDQKLAALLLIGAPDHAALEYSALLKAVSLPILQSVSDESLDTLERVYFSLCANGPATMHDHGIMIRCYVHAKRMQRARSLYDLVLRMSHPSSASMWDTEDGREMASLCELIIGGFIRQGDLQLAQVIFSALMHPPCSLYAQMVNCVV